MSKKTVEEIDSNHNRYIIQVKGNQPALLEQLKENTRCDEQSVASCCDKTIKRGRVEIRETFVYKDISGISEEWTGLKRLIRVERSVTCKGKERRETAYYISNIRSNRAEFFAKHIRSHWGIENRLHWVKDVIMKEDDSRIAKGMAAENLSVIRNIVCNLYRSNGFDSIKYAIELYANNFKELFELINSKITKYKIT